MIKHLIVLFVISFLLSLVLGKMLIPKLRQIKAGQNILCYLKEHFCKSGTPTMGGLFFIASAVVVFAFAVKGEKSISILCAVIFIAYGLVGFLDDFIKIKLCHNEGLTPLQKILFQCAVAVIGSIFAYRMCLTKLYLPFTNQVIDIGLGIIPLSIFVFLATSNCVNLTDGLDGLAGSVSIFALIFSAILIVLQTRKMDIYVLISEYENITKLCICSSGAILGFLIYNTYRASVFMGDTGSLALGGLFASIMIFSGNALYIPIIGIMFVLSGISVIVQVVCYKLTKKRVFLMAPLHHHFEKKGKSESKIVFAYSAITVIAGCLSIITFM